MQREYFKARISFTCKCVSSLKIGYPCIVLLSILDNIEITCGKLKNSLRIKSDIILELIGFGKIKGDKLTARVLGLQTSPNGLITNK